MLGKKSRRGILLDTKETATELKELADKYKMNIDPYSKIWQLSVGEQQRVEILTAIYQGADILILDEPTAVLTPQEANILFDMLRHMKADGKSIILITHKLEEIISIVDEVTVLRDGELIGSKLVDEHTTKEELTKMMVGRDVLFNFDKNPAGYNQVINQISNDEEECKIAFLLNDRYADGTDISWIWDVDFEALARQSARFTRILVSGVRADDMALRLKYAGFDTGRIEVIRDYENLLEAIGADETPTFIMPTYTAMFDLRGEISKHTDIKAFYE